MLDKIKNFFKKKNDQIKISITINGEYFENISEEEASEIFKQLSEKLKKPQETESNSNN